MKRAASILLSLAAPVLALSLAAPSALAAERVVEAPAAASPAVEAPGLKQAVFSGGCFWGVAGVFAHVTGVTSVVAGYHGGASVTARYERVSGGDTGHAESVRVLYDPARVRYDQLLRIFFSVIADPTTLNRQGPDEGTQYRSALVPLNPEQRRVAATYLAQLGKAHLWGGPIVTRIEPYRQFYPAEAYHQDFMARHPDHPYIAFWDMPKLAQLKRLFPTFYREQPVLN